MLERGLTRLRGKKPSALYFTNLSRAYLMLNQRAEAVEAARRGLALIGESVELLDALGLALANTGEHEQAIKAWHAALAHSPNAAKANFNLATSLLALHRTDEALEALDRSLVMEPTFPETLRLRAQLEISADHWDLAEKYLRPLYEAHPEMPNVRYMYGYWLLHAGTEAGSNHDAAAAERYFREGLTVDPSSADLQLSLGVLLVATRRFDEALPLLESYHRLQPEYAQGCAMLGQAYIGVGRTTDARKVLMEGEELARRTDDAANGDLCRELLQRL
jgi:tetratricopeptide (TPR) repeat protein